MSVNIAGEKKARVSAARLRKAALTALSVLGRARAGLTIVLADDAKLGRLNRLYRGKKGPTDILSFATGDLADLGDIFISLKQARKKAAKRGMARADYLTLLAVHGVLHLCGFDHERTADAEKMEKKENAIMRKLNVKL